MSTQRADASAIAALEMACKAYLDARYAQLQSEGRRALLGRARPSVFALSWPRVVAALMWFGRGAEEIVWPLLAGVRRALRVWNLDSTCGLRPQLAYLLLFAFAWLVRRRVSKTRARCIA